jgi:hypothetical protein
MNGPAPSPVFASKQDQMDFNIHYTSTPHYTISHAQVTSTKAKCQHLSADLPDEYLHIYVLWYKNVRFVLVKYPVYYKHSIRCLFA